MSFTIEKKDNHALIKVNVEKMDGTVAPTLKSELVISNSTGVSNMIMDLTDTRYCDSSGLSTILVGNRLCKNSGGTFVICGVQDPVMKLISISQLDSILNIAANTSAAEELLLTEKVDGKPTSE